MSNHLITEAYKRQVGNMARKAVMVLLADKASDDGTGIWASKQRMADEIGASKQTVIATIKSLIADGLIREAGQRRCPNGFTVEYAINVKALRQLPLVKCHADDQSENLTGQKSSPVKMSDRTGQAALPHRSENLTQTPQNPPKPPIKEPEGSCASADAPLTTDEVLEGWNQLAQVHGLAQVRKLTEARRRKVLAQAKRFTVPDWQAVFAKIAQSPFLKGDNRQGWRCDFDFILSENNFVKILEGKYDRQ